MSRFRELIEKKTLLCDGPMGTMLQASVLKEGQCPELLNIEKPDDVIAVHKAYINAGADILETNTFGANRVKLSAYGLENQTKKINSTAVDIAKKAAGNNVLVAGNIGPTGKFLEPVGDLTFGEALEIFTEQISALAEVDLFILETFSDIKEIRAAVIAAKSLGETPIAALMTFQPDGNTLLGTSPEAAAVTLDALGVDALGTNCGLGPDGVLDVLRRMAAVTELPLVSMPNAGIPRLVDGKTVFPASPDDVARLTEDFLSIGTGIMGGCCGNTPEHIKRLKEEIAKHGASPVSRILPDPGATSLSSRGSVLFIGGNSPMRAIGERLNPTGRKVMAEAVTSGNLSLYQDQARQQVEAGAHMLDVNVGVPGVDEPAIMHSAVLLVQQTCSVPLSIDSPRLEVVEAGLMASDGKPLVNSVTGEEESLNAVLPLVSRYGAAVLGLCLDENGIPEKAEQRLKIAERILEKAKSQGIEPRNLLIDCLVLSAGAEQEIVAETLKAVRLVREKLGLNTVLGVSNVSFGLPARENLNAAFLAMAASAGLSAAIVNPMNETLMKILAASRVILNQDANALDYIRIYSDIEEVKAPDNAAASDTEQLHTTVVEGNEQRAGELAAKLLDSGMAPLQISEEVLIPAMSEVGGKFARNEYFLPQVLMSANAMKAAFGPIRESLLGQDLPSRGKILIATVEGDIHDIGKNIVITLLENHAYDVVDLGKNVSADTIVERAKAEECQAIGLSALMTTTMIKMKEAVSTIKDAGLGVPVVVGGAAVTQQFADEIGADGYANDATTAVELFNKFIGQKG